MASSHAPAPHLPAESESPTLRSLISLFGAGPGQPKAESVTAKDENEDFSSHLPPLPPRDGLLLGTVSAVGKSIRTFTRNDLFKSVLPNAIFGITAAIADIHLRGGVEDAEARFIFAEIIKTFPITYLFNFCALLIFHLGTQRPREHIARGRWWVTAAANDSNNDNNKPRSPSSSSSSSAGQIRRAYLLLLPLTLALNRYFGVWHEGLMINLLTFIYNDLINRSSSGKHEQPPFVRDIILGITFGYINSASLKIALSTASAGSSTIVDSPHGHTWTWLNLTSVLIATTIGCQEFKTRHHNPDHHHADLEAHQETTDINVSDSADKKTPNPRKKALAIFLGEAAVPRAQLAMMMPLWTLICAVFWGLKWPVAAAFVAYSLFVASRVLTQRTVGAEERTWRFWKRWMVVVYLFPVVAVLSAAP
ncbi:hypothetical protein B0T20DRAFT_40470 [Sordaria brevicollis]|uniref:Uncharacterized protein n=1 Tax=Sordaria brevicollis TaxID=83679 RepID=A0AAE0P939_SORBR|nr:hypothetical protein B0T20DRAFT_40470 [Sordaria brevicollis]